ncbi:hypothetical protein M8818_002513 [Zalaria obscura]|uniref:Uncharacterized protein n=1 Tax=Zalaria obscura TaxID=2024903 RepID=A0ACC3SGM9_9PEZI
MNISRFARDMWASSGGVAWMRLQPAAPADIQVGWSGTRHMSVVLCEELGRMHIAALARVRKISEVCLLVLQKANRGFLTVFGALLAPTQVICSGG